LVPPLRDAVRQAVRDGRGHTRAARGRRRRRACFQRRRRVLEVRVAAAVIGTGAEDGTAHRRRAQVGGQSSELVRTRDLRAGSLGGCFGPMSLGKTETRRDIDDTNKTAFQQGL